MQPEEVEELPKEVTRWQPESVLEMLEEENDFYILQ
jgi:hypothetical protein